MDKDNKNRTVSRVPRWKNEELNGCFIRLGLDTRHSNHPSSEAPVSIIIQKERVLCYHHLPYKVTRARYDEIYKSTGRGKNGGDPKGPYAMKQEIEGSFESALVMLKKRFGIQPFSPKQALQVLQGLEVERTAGGSLTDLWLEVAANPRLKHNTQDSYNTARNSFIKFFGEREGFVYTPDEINKWEDDIISKAKDGHKTTVGFYERALKVVMNEAIERGLMSREDYPFGGRNGIKIPRGARRQKQYLNVNKMTELYQMFERRDYPSGWTDDERAEADKYLGMFLLQYLCNGCNLRDLALLQYNDYYFNTGGKAFSFLRGKTARRNDTDQLVEIPIIPQLQLILDRIAAPPQKDGLVFPWLLNGATTEEEIDNKVKEGNKDVRKCMHEIAQHLEWTVRPGGAWCRHSFATNLEHANPELHNYVHQAIGHALAASDVTGLYIDLFPLEKQFEYNSLLLGSGNQEDTVKVSSEQYKAFLQWLADNQEKKNDQEKKI